MECLAALSKRLHIAHGVKLGNSPEAIQTQIRKLVNERKEREHDAKKIAGLNDEVAGLRADLTIMRTINANRNLFGVARKEAKNVA